MKGVILGICPEAQVVDITHEIGPWQVAHGAWMLEQAWHCFPEGTIHIAVVDPGVGSVRRPIVAEAGGHLFVGPDNGVLSRVFDAVPPRTVRTVTAAEYFRHPVSRTFHGRDIFAPVAAHLANDLEPEQLGPLAEDWVKLSLPVPVELENGVWQGEVLWVDRFGNLVTSFAAEAFGWVATEPFQLEMDGYCTTQYAQYYGAMKVGPCVIFGSAGYLEVSLNQQHAADLLGGRPGSSVVLRRV